MVEKISKVSIVKCKSYKQSEVDRAVEKSLKLAKIELPFRKKVLIKPNIVSADVKHLNATVTQPQIIDAVCKILKKNNCKIFIGESSFMNTPVFMKKVGLDKLSKLKTHQLMKFTGAVKNLFGFIPGGLKQKLHVQGSSEKKFGDLLIDIYQNFDDKMINIMDGVIGMEGKGPTSGSPVNSGFILASKNAIALDIVSSKLIGYNPKKIFSNKQAIKRGFGSWDYELVGLKKLPNLNFKKPFIALKTIRNILFGMRKKPIVVDEKKCIRCGICRDHCPTKAITLNPFPVIDKKKCIRCFCCMEICPRHALSLKEN